MLFFFFQAEDDIRHLVRSRGLGDVYKRQLLGRSTVDFELLLPLAGDRLAGGDPGVDLGDRCLLYTSDAADERSHEDLGGRRIIKKKKKHTQHDMRTTRSSLAHVSISL